MNSHKPKGLGKLLILFLLSMQLFNCTSSTNARRVTEVSVGIVVEADNYSYSKESIFKAGGRYYSLRAKSIYAVDDTIKQLIVYKPEGSITYGKAEIFNDLAILENFGLPVTAKWIYSSGHLRNTEGNIIAVEKINEGLVKSEREGKVFIYKIE